MTIAHVKDMLKDGPVQRSIVVFGGSAQLTIKVTIHKADEFGILCQTKGMMGGWSGMQFRPWSSIVGLDLDA